MTLIRGLFRRLYASHGYFFIDLTIKMIMQVVYIMGMWSVLADRKFIETTCSVQYQRYVLTKENAWLINNIFV